jgi:hypothetical protein
MTGSVQCFDRLNVGHGQMIGHAELSRHFRAEIAQHNQTLLWPVLTRTWLAGFERAMTHRIRLKKNPNRISVSFMATTPVGPD